jgi:hypothetical protein
MTLAAGRAAALAGCAGIDSVTSDVSSFGDWPAGRKHRAALPSSACPRSRHRPNRPALEKAAARALAKAGFEPDGGRRGARRAGAAGRALHAHDGVALGRPAVVRGGFGRFHRGPWIGPSWSLGWTYQPPRYEHEVALLLRDRASGKPLYETRAASEASAAPTAPHVAAMFEAAMADFPRPG